MNVSELLSFQPNVPTPGEQPSVSGGSLGRRKRRFDADGITRSAADSEEGGARKSAKIDKEKILKMLDDEPEVEALNEVTLKKLILQFEKKACRNQEMRIKYSDAPEKNERVKIGWQNEIFRFCLSIEELAAILMFMESEVELNDVIQEMHVIATVPDLYYIVVELNTVQSMLQLLCHDNTDISIAVIDLIQEMTDVDTLNESEDGANVLIDALLQGQVLALLVQNLDRLDETIKEEADGVHNTLTILENMTEIRSEACIDATQQGFMAWFLKRMRAKMPFDENKLYCSELLSILLQTHEVNRASFGEMDGIDVVLQQLSLYKKHDPSSSEEIEYMENLFNCLCSALMLADNRGRFLRGEGLQLMNLLLREKKMSRTSALKVLDHAMIGVDGVENCQKFIDIVGLRSLFPLFMKTPHAHKKAGPTTRQLEEHIISIVASLVKNCEGSQRQRLLHKFVENDHEKVDRLMELHFKYLEKMRSVDDAIEKQKRELRARGEELTEEMEEDQYMKRLEAGLFSLQLIDYIMLQISHSCQSSVRQRVVQMINLRGGSIKAIKSIMREYAGNIGDSKDSKSAEQEKILQLVDRF